MWIKNTDGIHSWNLMDSKPPEYLLPKLLPNINQIYICDYNCFGNNQSKERIAPAKPQY